MDPLTCGTRPGTSGARIPVGRGNLKLAPPAGLPPPAPGGPLAGATKGAPAGPGGVLSLTGAFRPEPDPPGRVTPPRRCGLSNARRGGAAGSAGNPLELYGGAGVGTHWFFVKPQKPPSDPPPWRPLPHRPHPTAYKLRDGFGDFPLRFIRLYKWFPL